MLHPIMTDAKVPDSIGNTVFAWILVIGGITVLYYVIWLLICRGPGCRRYPNHPVWLQQLMDRDFFAINLMAAVIFFQVYFFIAMYLTDIIYHLLAKVGLVELVE